MNRYGRMAMAHWSRFVPQRYRTISDPETYFSTLGQEVQEEIETMTDQIAGDDPGGETHLAKVGRLNSARQRAEEAILPERVLVPAERHSAMDEQSPTSPT